MSKVTEQKWSARFSENGGYDCMTHAWFIVDEENRFIITIDLSTFGQKNCDYDFRSEEAEQLANHIVEVHNKCLK